MKNRIQPYWELCRPKISALSAFSAAAGFSLASGGMRGGAGLTSAGVFLLAGAASCLNQYQERGTDALMQRTKGRPLPAGTIKPRSALLLFLVFSVSGFVILRTLSASSVPSLLGLLALLWYNGVYTSLKRITAFAAIPGALVGVLPPAIGWTAGGGILTDPRLAFLCFFFFMWQTPHFWLLLLDRGPEYEAAGLPSLTRTFGKAQLVRIVFVWTVAAGASLLLVGMEGIVRNSVVNLALCASSIWLIWSGTGLFRGDRLAYSSAFHRINIFAFVAMLLMSIDGLVRNLPIYR